MQVRALRKKHSFMLVGVVGGIGKTSTKLAIAQTLGKSKRVRYQDGNYNDLVSVPLILFGQDMPSLFNPFGWLSVFVRNTMYLFQSFPYDAVVVELGTDGPGQIATFARYLTLDVAVVTAIVPEHMEYFDDLDAVAKEELSVAAFSKKVIYNADLVAATYAKTLPAGSISYSMQSSEADYYVANIFQSIRGIEGDIKHGGEIVLHVSHEVISKTQLYSVLAAVVVGAELQLKMTDIKEGISAIKPVSGRLRRLRGINSSTIIDDTYNASPDAVKAALEALYSLEAPQKIALLGSMNELGALSSDAHKEVGALCDPVQLSMVVTIGKDANAYLAPAAEAKGCLVKKFDSPYEAGEYLQTKINPGAVILAKGSQNRVFAEEAVKLLLADSEDAAKLVRQSPYWLKRKHAQFKEK